MDNHAANYDGDNDDRQPVSDTESCVSVDSNKGIKCERLFDGDLIRLNENEAIFDVIGHQFLSNLRRFGESNNRFNAVIEAIHKMNWSKSVMTKARLQCFNIYRHALLQFNDDCMEYLWYCDSKQRIQSIISNGFGYRELGSSHGIQVFPSNSLAQRVQNCVDDNDGLKHVLLCRVLVMNKESPREINSSEVDSDVISPSQYVVCSTKMNTHILPEYIVSFRIFPCLEGTSMARHTSEKPASSPRMPFQTLISTISKFLPPNTMKMIDNSYKEFMEGKISRQDWIRRLRRLAGNDLLVKTIKYHGTNN